jgi:glyoxylase-like metal-dependent hydrolase (beta-lactamase superfamily II)
MFLTNLDKEVYEPRLRESGQRAGELALPYTCLFVDTGRHRVLLDTGIGAFPLGPTQGRLVALLRDQGVEPGEIDTVVLSHAHPDHLGGSVDAEGRPAFHNARYVMARKEWDYWTSNPSLAELGLDDNFKAYILATTKRVLAGVQPQLDLIQPDKEIVPGVIAIAAYGHTPGHMMIEVTLDGQRLLFAADAVILPLHLEFPETISAVDHMPAEMVATRIKVLEKAAREKPLVLISHFPFPSLGHVVPKGDRWGWRSMEAATVAK